MNKKLHPILVTIGFAVVAASAPSLLNRVFKSAQASENTISSFVNYDFANNGDNIGKDSSDNKFNLLSKNISAYSTDVCKIVDEGGDKYLEITNHCGTKNDGGYFLYAPQLGDTGRDVSDLLYGSFTVSVKLKFDASINYGSNYILTFGRYGDCLTMVPYNNGVEFQLYNSGVQGLDSEAEAGNRKIERYRAFYALGENVNDYKNNWHTFTIVGNNEAKTMTVYDGNTEINSQFSYPFLQSGEQLPEFKGAKLSDETGNAGQSYTLCLGAQCTYLGTSSQQYGSAKYKFLRIYDCALSADNVANINAGLEPVLDNEPGTKKDAVIIAVNKRPGDTYDNKITDVNTVDKLIKQGLPSKVEVEFEGGNKVDANVSWFKSNNANEKYIYGLPQLDGYYNLNKHLARLDYIYVADIKYDNTLVKVEDITLDGSPYVPGSELAEAKDYTLKFKVTQLSTKKEISKIMCDGIKYKPDAQGYVSVSVSGKRGGLVDIVCATKQGSVTYIFKYNDEDYVLGTSIYTPDGQQGICTNEDVAQEINALKLVDGQKFKVIGLYLDEEFTMLFTSEDLNYDSPTSIILYAKAELQPKEGSGGCGSSIDTTVVAITISALMISILIACKLVLKRKEQ